MEIILETDLNVNNVAKSKLLVATFDYWFSDHDHIRSPIPKGIHVELKKVATERFSIWLQDLPKIQSEHDKKDLTDEVLHGKLEEFIFDEALKMLSDEDEKLTLMFPFLPRIGDKITPKDGGKEDDDSYIISREMVKEGDHTFVQVELEEKESKKHWSTKFELPA